MKKLYLCLFILSFEAQASSYSNMDSIKSKMTQLYGEAVNCLPEKTKDGVRFCTGFKLSKKDLKKLHKMSFAQCKKEINQKYGFKLTQEVQPRQLEQKEYSAFMNSTKRAQVYYREKLVLMKQKTGRVDCVHELLHLYQRFSKNKSALSISSRTKLEKSMVFELEKQIKRVESLEKQKKIVQAQKISKELQSYISWLNKIKGMWGWLHEKEIYYHIYKNCELFNCSTLDKDIALANLYKYKDFFPWRVRDWLIAESAKLIKQKEYEVYKDIDKNWKPVTSIEKKLLTEMIETDLEDLKSKMREKKVYFIKNSLFREGVICDKGELVILHKGELDHALVVAASLRKKQLELNKWLCSHWVDTRKVAKEFQRGAIPRDDYESKVLKSKMAKVRSDLDVYNILFKHQEDFPTDETSLILDRWLSARTSSTFSVWEARLPKVFEKGMTIRFSERDDLPMVYVNSRKLVLDLGAMDSVIRPIALSTEQLKSMVVLETKTLATAEGRTLIAPKVMLTTPMVHSGKSWMSTRWVLADLKIIGVDGTFGLNNFFGNDFSINPKTRVISFTEFKKKPQGAFEIQPNFRGDYDAVEFKCPEGHIIRVDSGSQIRGDLKREGLRGVVTKSGVKCGKLKFKGPFEEVINTGPIFGRDVVLNLGWPLLREFKKIDISLDKGWVHFTR